MIMSKLNLPKLTEYTESSKKREFINWIAIVILMVFYAGTWLFPWFYHVTEIYNTSIVFAALVILFFNNVDWISKLKNREWELYALGAGGVIALANLFIIGSHKGCILIIADFLLLWYLAKEVKLTNRQLEFMCGVFVFVFLIWFAIDLAFSYNSNTGASVTVFTFMCAMIFLTRLSVKREIYGLLIVLCVVRLVNLVLWHLARGAFLALFLLLFFYYIAPKVWWKDRKMFSFLCLFSTFGSLVFVFSYVMLASTGVNFKMPFFYKSLFSGREQIWMEVWNMLRQHLLTGIGSGYELESFFEYNIHNVMYDILAVHGVIVFALAMFIILRRLFAMRPVFERGYNSADKSHFNLKILAASGLFAMFIESFIDMDLMWADYSPVVLFLLLIIFADEKR